MAAGAFYFLAGLAPAREILRWCAQAGERRRSGGNPKLSAPAPLVHEAGSSGRSSARRIARAFPPRWLTCTITPFRASWRGQSRRITAASKRAAKRLRLLRARTREQADRAWGPASSE